MSENQNVKIGYMTVAGQKATVAEYTDDQNRLIWLVNIAYGGLYVYIDKVLTYRPGDKNGAMTEYVYIWTRIAGHLGSLDLMNKLKR